MINDRLELLLEKSKQMEQKRRVVLQALTKRQPYRFQGIESAISKQAKSIEDKLEHTNKSFEFIQDKITTMFSSTLSRSPNYSQEQKIIELNSQIQQLQFQNRSLKDQLKQRQNEVLKLRQLLRQKDLLEQQIKKKNKIATKVRFKLGNLQTDLKRLKLQANQAIQSYTFYKGTVDFDKIMAQVNKQSGESLKKQQLQYKKEANHSIKLEKTKTQSFENEVYQICLQLCRLTQLQIFPRDSIVAQYPNFGKQLLGYLSMINFIAETTMNLDFHMKKWLLSSIKSQVPIPDRPTTKLIYRFDSSNKVNFHQYFDNKPNICLLVKLKNGQIIGAFTHYPFIKDKKQKPGKGFIFNLTKRLLFPRKEETTHPVAYYDDYYIGFGHSQVRIRSQQLKLFSNFGLSSATFDPLTYKRIDFTGSSQSEVDIESYQIHQVIA